MINLNKKEIDVITNFYKDYTDSVMRILSDKFDLDVFGKMEFSIESVSQVSDISHFKENNAIYKFSFSVDKLKGTYLALVPEEFILFVSDLVMGGDGKKKYEGTLSELEVNAALGMFNSMIDDVKITFKSLYVKEFNVVGDSELLVQDNPNFNQFIGSKDFDLAVVHKFSFGDGSSLPIILLAQTNVVKQMLINIELLEEMFVADIPSIMPMRENDKISGIDNIADIKINIAAELGRIKLPIKQVMGLVNGSIIELDTHDGSDIKVFANGLEVARAQVVVVDEHFGIKITKIISPEERYKEV